MNTNPLGRIVDNCWLAIPQHFPNVELDAHVVMPNHIHGILVLVAAQHAAPVTKPLPRFAVKPRSLGATVRSFKSAATKRANELRLAPGPDVWQRNYHEHVIRNEASLQRIRDYIATNPLRWDLDAENPQRKGENDFDRWLRISGRKPAARR